MSSRGKYRRHAPEFKIQLCQDIRSGAIGRRDAARKYTLSTNLIQLWLTQYDRGEPGTDETEPTYAKRISPSKLDPYAEKLATWLGIEATKSRKQRRNLKQIYTGSGQIAISQKCHESWRDHWIIGKTHEVQLQRGKGIPTNRVCLDDRSVLVTLALQEVQACTLTAGHGDLLTISRLQDLAFGEMDDAIKLVGRSHFPILENEHSATVLQAVGLVDIACQRVGGKSGRCQSAEHGGSEERGDSGVHIRSFLEYRGATSIKAPCANARSVFCRSALT